ncbi:MAG: hypothetical protein QXP77_03905 [Candidatus Aenigmatarchaeota archaeon]
MIIELNYLEARKVGYLGMWKIDGKDRENNPISFYINHLANKPEPNLTYLEARDVKAEMNGDCLFLLDEVILKRKKEWEYDPDHPRNLAKAVTTK